MGPIEHVEFLSRSEHRVSVLRHLRESGPTTRREFRDELSASRSTVTRSLSALEERGWITSNSETYRLTAAGREITDRFLELTDTVELTERLLPFLRWFPESDLRFDLERLTDASIAVSTDSDPFAPVRKHMAVFQQCRSFRGVMPSIDAEAARTFRNQMSERDLTIDLVFTPGITERFSNPEYRPLMGEILDGDDCRLFVTDADVPYYLGIADDEVVQIGVEDDQGYPQALLETDEQAVYEWATDEFEWYHERASLIEDV